MGPEDSIRQNLIQNHQDKLPRLYIALARVPAAAPFFFFFFWQRYLPSNFFLNQVCDNILWHIFWQIHFWVLHA